MTTTTKPRSVWALAEATNANLGTPYFSAFAPDIKGYVAPFTWSGIIDLGWLDMLQKNLDWCESKGLKLIPSLNTKAWNMAIPNPPANILVPSYVAADISTYGGELGGMVKSFSSGSWIGWALNVSNPKLLKRLIEDTQNLISRFSSHPAWGGLQVGEFGLSVRDTSQQFPPGTTSPQWQNAELELMQVGGQGGFAVINFGDIPWPDSQSLGLALTQVVSSLGINVSLSDVLIPPGSQPEYSIFPLKQAINLGHICWMSTTTDPTVAAQFWAETAVLGLDVVAIVTRGGVTGPYWQAYQKAIAANP